MKTLIIEDEKAALRNLKAAMKEVDADFDIVGETDSVTGTLEWFASHPMPELVFIWPTARLSASSNMWTSPAPSFSLPPTTNMPCRTSE